MNFFYSTLSAYAIIASFVSTAYAYKISRMNLSPTFTYSVYAVGSGLQFIVNIWGLAYTKQAIQTLQSFNVNTIIISVSIRAIIVACYLIFIVRKYRYYKNTYKNLRQ